MWPVSDTYRAALAGPHRIQTRADVLKAGQVLYSGLPVTGGTVTVDARSITRRGCSLTLAPRLRTSTYQDIPTFPRVREGALLGTDGHEVRLRQGLVYPGGRTEWIPVGVFRVDDLDGSLLGRGTVSLHGVSREAWVADDRFVAPRTLSGPSAVAIIRGLILQSFAAAEITVLTRADRPVRPMVVDEDRWGAITTLADSIGAVVYADPTGRFVIANGPRINRDPVWQFRAGPGGIMVDTTGRRSRDGVYNRVVVSGQTPQGATAPVRAAASDLDPTSPTRFGDPSTGAWGRRTKYMHIPSLTRSTQCERVAQMHLARVTGAGSQLDISAVPVAALEALDVVTVVTDHENVTGTISRHIIDRFTLPLTPGRAFPVTTRDLGRVS